MIKQNKYIRIGQDRQTKGKEPIERHKKHSQKKKKERREKKRKNRRNNEIMKERETQS